MKKIVVAIIMLISFSIANIMANENNALAARYVKLANTYINSNDFNNAFDFLKKAENTIKNVNNWEADYWRAAIDEAYGVSFMRMNMKSDAQNYLQKALNQYNKLINMPNGSNHALIPMIANLENTLSGIDNDYSSAGAIAGIASNSKIVNLDDKKMRDIPSSIPQSVENLSVAYNNVRDFPMNTAMLKNLKYLNLEKNRISTLNVVGSQFNSLIWLNLSNNRIRNISPGLGNMRNLEFLDLSDNRIKSLPPDISNLKSLKILNIKGNRIPFADVKTLIQSMPNTNIIHDEYVPKADDEFEVDEF